MVYDLLKGTCELVGRSNDSVTHNIVEMQKEGFDVLCQSSNSDARKGMDVPGYIYEEGLYHRLINDYFAKTFIQLKEW